MESLKEQVAEYKKQLKKGNIQAAYKGLMEYLMSVRSNFASKYPNYFVSGSIYQGYMDMTYFSFTPESLKSKKLRIAIVLIHNTVRFEVWLVGYNKQIQTKYWKLFKGKNWNMYHIPSSTKGVDSIAEYILTNNPDFSNLDALTKQIESGALKFIEDIENFLAENLN